MAWIFIYELFHLEETGAAMFMKASRNQDTALTSLLAQRKVDFRLMLNMVDQLHGKYFCI